MAASSWALLSLLFLVICLHFGNCFDVREHLSSTTRYDVSRRIGEDFQDLPQPAGCVPIHLDLVARHGTRSPTRKRLKQLEELEAQLKKLLAESKNADRSMLSWLDGWHTSWKGRFVGGELVVQGEEEMFHLGRRVGSRFPEIFSNGYHPDSSPILSSQIHRASQSAVAFGMGLFSGKGSLGPGRHRAFSVISDNRTYDIHLRFHDCCHNYKESKALRKPVVAKQQDDVYNQVASEVSIRYNISFVASDIASLWFLCKQEASVLELASQACALFSPQEVEMLEWADDIELHQLKGYGDSINYKMGIYLLRNVKEAMERAMEESDDPQEFKIRERARFRFAHAETVIPFACLLGFFLETGDAKLVQEERSVDMPRKPPHPRLWRGSVIAPYGANTMLVLYKCSGDNSGFKVQAFHNEKPVTMPGCNHSHLCPVDTFMSKVVAPHMKHSFEGICFKPKSASWRSWITRLLGFGGGAAVRDDDAEL